MEIHDNSKDWMQRERAVLTLQRYWRGCNTRKSLLQVYSLYYNTVEEIDGYDPRIELCTKCFKCRKYILSRPALMKNNHCGCEHYSDDETFASEVVSTDVDGRSNDEDNITAETIHSSSSPITPNETNCVESNENLLNEKRDLTMELMWVQQAIESRRNYLQIKDQLG